ncbi:MAG: hypothetical protein FWE10_04600 [Rikenellaceae bacterium]|nr:hypothetical protein [Rikenellaceae bacterium]MCL2692070.1 hypothetical protein [Rikenellaceae bacterium]
MAEESHKDIAYRHIKEYQQDPKGFEMKYAHRPEIVEFFKNEGNHKKYIELASGMDLTENDPLFVKDNMPELFAVFGSIMTSRINTFDLVDILQKIPTKFNEWKSEIDSFSGKTKQRKIKELLEYYRCTLSGDSNIYEREPILKIAFERVKDELIEQQQYWETKLHEFEDIDNSSPEENPLKTRIERYFAFMKERDARQNAHILSEKDFDRLIEWITYYFEHDLNVPNVQVPIQHVHTSKGNIYGAFREFFRFERPRMSLPNSLFELIKVCFYPYRDDIIDNMRKTKKPADFERLFK